MSGISVCYPYEFTLLSNAFVDDYNPINVCYPYEFTLLSNTGRFNELHVQFVTPMNLHCSQTLYRFYNACNGLLPL